MNNPLARILLVISMVFLPALSTAQTEQISVTRTITEIYTYDTGALIRFTPAASGHGCPGGQATTSVYIDWASNAGMRVIMANAMLAQAGGKIVGFGVNGCNPTYGAGNGVPLVYRIDVRS